LAVGGDDGALLRDYLLDGRHEVVGGNSVAKEERGESDEVHGDLGGERLREQASGSGPALQAAHLALAVEVRHHCTCIGATQRRRS